MKRYICVLRATSAVRIPPREKIRVAVSASNEPYGSGSVPRHLWLEVVGSATSLEEARQSFQNVAEGLCNALASTMNSAIEPLVPTVVFDATEEENEHDFWQFVLPPNIGLPNTSRALVERDFLEIMNALEGHIDCELIERALGHYRASIVHLVPGELLLAMSHAWMGFEALKVVALRQELDRQSLSRAELASIWNVKTSQLEGEARLRLLFSGRSGLHRRARRVSDELEHSVSPFGTLQSQAEADAHSLVTHLRRGILKCPFAKIPRTLLRNGVQMPLACAPLQRHLRTTLYGNAADLAPSHLQYPHFDLTIETGNVILSPTGGFTISQSFKVIDLLGEGVRRGEILYQVWGPTDAGE
jgi:hypothetical protein